MRTMKIGKSGIETSVVGMGAWAIGGDSMWGASDDAESIRTIHHARELGVTLLDTAPAYGLGHSEEVVGKALAGRRGDYVLSTKCGLRWDNKAGALMMERDGVRIVRNTRPESLAEEIIYNAISSAVSDPRFPPVSKEELEDITISVDVLGRAEAIRSVEELDVKRFGVIVSNGCRRGLLLPDLEGVDTVSEQVAIAKRKAGIGEAEEVSLQRFEVKRYQEGEI